MILIIGFWAVYLNKTIVNLGPAKSEKITNRQFKLPKNLLASFLTGFKIIISQTKALITATREISIEGGASNFATSSEAISPNLCRRNLNYYGTQRKAKRKNRTSGNYR